MTDTTADLETSIKASLATIARHWDEPGETSEEIDGCHGTTPTNEPCNLQAGHGGDCE